MTEKIPGAKLKPGDVCLVYLSSHAKNEEWTVLLLKKQIHSRVVEWKYIRLTPEISNYSPGPIYVHENDRNEFEVLERLPSEA